MKLFFIVMSKFVIEAVVFIKRTVFNSVDAAILEYSGESTMHHGIFLGRPSRPKVVSIEIFTVSRDRFGLPDIKFSIQAIAVVLVFSVFLDRPWSSPWRFHIIAPVAWTPKQGKSSTVP